MTPRLSSDARVSSGGRYALTPALVLAASLVLGLTACVAPVPAPAPSTVAPSPSPTPTTEPVDPTVMPSNRYGIDCGSLVTPADLVPIFGAELPRDVSDKLNGFLSEELTQDGALQCRWGADRFWDESVPSITVTAVPYGRDELDSVQSSFVPPEGYTGDFAMAGVGDAAWANCGGYVLSLTCTWTVAVDDTWLMVSLSEVEESEADVTLIGNYYSEAVPRADSPGAILVARIAEAVRAAPVAEVSKPTVTVRECDTITDWESVAAEFGTGAPEVTSENYPDSSSLFRFVLSSIRDTAAENLGVRVCRVDFGESSSVQRASVGIRVIPGAGWIGGMSAWAGSGGLDAWGGWNGEDCHSGEGGYRCEISGFVNGSAAFVSIFGTPPEGMAARVFDLVTAP